MPHDELVRIRIHPQLIVHFDPRILQGAWTDQKRTKYGAVYLVRADGIRRIVLASVGDHKLNNLEQTLVYESHADPEEFVAVGALEKGGCKVKTRGGEGARLLRHTPLVH